MSIRSVVSKVNAMPVLWRQRSALLLIIACFAVPLAAAWLLVGRWSPDGSAQHGELLNPARPLTQLRFAVFGAPPLNETVVKGHWVLIHIGSAAECEAACRTALYDMRQVRLALGKDMGRVKTLLLLDGSPSDALRQWLADEHPTTLVGVTDGAAQSELIGAFGSTKAVEGMWIYLLDPLSNLVMRYPASVEPRGMLKDLQRLLRLSKIG